MKNIATASRVLAGLTLALIVLTGCESTDNGSTQVSGSMYYGVGFYDPWYYGPGYYPPDVIVTPPPGGGGIDSPPHVEHPIVTPSPPVATPRPTPTIPSAPRVSPRR